MRHLVGILALTFLLASLSHSQIELGVKGGMNFATIEGPDAISFAKTRTGFAVGAYAEFTLPLLLSIQPEVLYTTKGYRQDGATVGVLMRVTTMYQVYSYLEVPVLIGWTLPISTVKTKLYLGPSMAYLLGSKTKYEEPGGGEDVQDNKSFITSEDFGAVLGASAHILVVDVDFRYDLGLRTTINSGADKIYNRTWSIMVGIPLN